MIKDEERGKRKERGCGREEILKMRGKKQYRNEGMEEKGRKWRGYMQ